MVMVTDMRQFYEDSLNFVSDSLLKIKKKDLKKKVLSAATQKELQKVLDSYRWRFRLNGHDEGCCGSLFQLWNSFDKCNKYFLKDNIKPGCPTDNNLAPLFGEHDVIIYQVGEFLCMVTRNLSRVQLGDFESTYHALLYPCFKADSARHMRFQPYIEAYLSEDLTESVYMIPDEFDKRSKMYSNKMEDDYGNVMYIVPSDVLDIESEEYSVNLTQTTVRMLIAVLADLTYIAYVYNNRRTLNRSNGKARKHYEQHKVHVIREDATVDKIIPLHVYTKEYEPSIRSESKGGHHASPIEHDRRSHYRKSRGRGNYELIDGKMIYVGEMQGHYSLVSSTHVSGKKKSVIYKVN